MASQLQIFGTGPLVLADESGAHIAYYPDVLAPPNAAQLFAVLHADAPWSAEHMWMYEREVDVPRLRACYGDERVPAELASARQRVESVLGERFNSMTMNLYRDGKDSVAWHNDHRNEMVPRSTVALLSLGAARRMLIRTKARPRRTLSRDLAPGSLLVMSGRAQELWEHTIPKSIAPVEPRISVAFRHRPHVRNA